MNIDDLTRLEILLADQATGDLDRDGQRELNALLEGAELDDSFDMAAAAMNVALLPEEEPMPASLRAKLEHMAPSILPGETKPASQPLKKLPAPARQSSPMAWLGWLAAAACLVFALLILNQNKIPPEIDAATQRAEFLESGQMIQNIDWSATEDPSAEGASGDVLWSNTQQKGFMRIRGLEANNPDTVQYQLWIFDGDRENPVDGGVFDIPAGASEVIVPIDAKLLVGTPTLFAITVEKPGGVVVSKRERIVLVAQPSTDG